MIYSLLTSYARLEALRVLSELETPAYIRQIANLSKLPIRSIQLALKGLINDKIVKKRIFSKRSYYSINTADQRSQLLSKIFQMVSEYQQQIKADGLNKKAIHVLDFVSSSLELIQTAKKGMKKQNEPPRNI